MKREGVQIFYMYNSERLLRFANEYLGIRVEQESIKSIADVVQAHNETDAYTKHKHIMETVYQWLSKKYPLSEITDESPGFDYLVCDLETNTRIAFDVLSVADAGSKYFSRNIVTQQVQEAVYSQVSGRLDNYYLLIVADSESSAMSLREMLIDERHILVSVIFKIADGRSHLKVL